MSTINTLTRGALACFAAAAFAAPASAASIACKTEKAFKGGGGAEWAVSLEVDDAGRVVGIGYSGMMSSGQEGGAYFCELNAAAKAKDSKWAWQPKRTLVTDLKDGEDSSLEILAQADGGYRVVFTEVKTIPYCGFGAEFPEFVVVRKGRRTCEVKR